MRFDNDLSAASPSTKVSAKSMGVFAATVMIILGGTLMFSTGTKKTLQNTISQNGLQLDESNSKPNFVFVLVDDLGYNEHQDLSAAMSFIKELAGKGISMTNYYSQETCSPSRASLLTGRYPVNIGMQYGAVGPTNEWGLDESETLLPEVLRAYGDYKNYAIGKWNLGHYSPKMLPTARGFDSFFGFVDGQNHYWSKRNPDYDDYYDFMYSDKECYNLYDGDDRNTYSTALYGEKAVKVIESHNFNKNPMFMYFAAQAVHDPFTDSAKYDDTSVHSYLKYDKWQDFVEESKFNEVMDSVTGGERKQYALSLMVLDKVMKDIHNALANVKQLDNTYIIFASDNGGCFMAGGKNNLLRGMKGSLFEGGTRVDAFIYSPLITNADDIKRYGGLMHVTDWFPTILSLANINNYTPAKGNELDGYNQANAIQTVGTPDDVREYMLYNIYTNVKDKHFDIYNNAPVAIRDKRYKLIHAYIDNPSAGWYGTDNDDGIVANLKGDSTCTQQDALDSGTYSYMLYDLLKDPYETTNLFDDPTYNDIKKELYAEIATYMSKAKIADSPQTTQDRGRYILTTWTDQGGFLQPWIEVVDGKDVFTSIVSSGLQSVISKSYPKRCTKTDSVFSPVYE